MTLLAATHPDTPTTASASATYAGTEFFTTEEARFRVAVDLAAGGLRAVGRECLQKQSQRSPESTLAQLAVYGGSVKGLAEANMRYMSNLTLMMKVVRKSAEKAAVQLSKPAKRALAECIESAERVTHDYQGAPQESQRQASADDAFALRTAAWLIQDLMVQLATQAALALSMLRSVHRDGAEYGWTVVATLLLSGSTACRTIEKAALSGVSERDLLVELVARSLRSEGLERLGPFADVLVSETASNLRKPRA